MAICIRAGPHVRPDVFLKADHHQTMTTQTPPIADRAVKRDKKARAAVLIADRVADRTITIGGISVILAVLAIMVFLVAQALPLFRSAKIISQHNYTLPPGLPVLASFIDENLTLAIMLTADGRLEAFHARTGRPLNEHHLDLNGKTVAAWAVTSDNRHIALGFSDGTAILAETLFETQVITAESLPGGLEPLDERDATDGTTVFSAVPGNQYRRTTFRLAANEPLPVADDGAPVKALAIQVSGEAERQTRLLAVLDGAGRLSFNRTQSKINLLTGERRTEVSRTPLPSLPQGAAVQRILMTAKGDALLVASPEGMVHRYNLQDPRQPVLSETVTILAKGVGLTVFDFLLGSQSIVAGGSDGSLALFFLINRPEARAQDGIALVAARRFSPGDAPATLFAAAGQSKSFAVAQSDGGIRLIHATSQKTLVAIAPTASPAVIRHLAISPRMDGLLAIDAGRQARLWELQAPHPETNFHSLFRRVWYEGHSEPTYTWQSSAASDEYESKLSLVPLIFGTIKAALYSMLFAVPLALLAAIYTSEFLPRHLRAGIKPVMEIMASLPSVVLGFVAALVLAPIVENWIAALILAFGIVPAALVAGALAWQFLPLTLAGRLQGIARFAVMVAVVLVALGAAIQLGPVFEDWFFDGDFKAWLNGDRGGAEPLLLILLFPLTLTAGVMVVARTFGRRLDDLGLRSRPVCAAALELARWLATAIGAAVLAVGLAKAMALLGVDARGGLVGTYVQRNTLIVGFAMGFAVIPIIYTIAEDALNSVPEHLRAASLGCGATAWQTAIYVVLPTAVSGVFSAVMVGMGRAVGETMIVVMSAGNTPIIDWNVFNGLRALSATIAVELPEAVKEGTLYRVLFLAGLILFAMTFVINTIAEIIRQRFRKRALQL
jgi:phosphate transport system permease protein